MDITNYLIRDSREGEENIKSDIFNKVMLKIDPNIPSIDSEEIRIRNPIYGNLRNRDEFGPENTKFLIHSDNGVVGYIEYYGRLGSYNLHYPLILKKHCSEYTLNLLFKAIYDLVRTKNARRIYSTYNNKYESIHTFFRNQKIAPIKSINENRRLAILTDQLDYNITGFVFVPFSRDKIDELINFKYSKEGIAGRDLSKEELVSGFKWGKYSPESSTLIYRNGKLVAWWSVRVNSPPYDYDKLLKYPIGVLNELVFDTNYEDLTELRKAMFKAGYSFLKTRKIPEFRVWTSCSGALYKEFGKYGFTLTGEGEYSYNYE
jgi:hypothetical protein